MTSAFLKWNDVNVVRVNWTIGANGRSYVRSAVNTQIVGVQVAIFIKRLIKQYNMDPDQFHIIGHSLGAHLAGFAGSKFAQMKIKGKNRKIARITGLDPAEPFFQYFKASL